MTLLSFSVRLCVKLKYLAPIHTSQGWLHDHLPNIVFVHLLVPKLWHRRHQSPEAELWQQVVTVAAVRCSLHGSNLCVQLTLQRLTGLRVEEFGGQVNTSKHPWTVFVLWQRACWQRPQPSVNSASTKGDMFCNNARSKTMWMVFQHIVI